MKTIKNIILATVAATTLVACNGFLDREPFGETTLDDVDSTLKPEDLLAGNLFDVYAHLKTWGVSTFAWMGMTSITSDDADKGSTSTDNADQLQLDLFTFNPNNGLIADFYASNFTGVTKCNQVLADLDDFSGDIGSLRAEARFLRAFYYFNLVRAFGGMPLVDRVMEQDENTPARASLADTYAFIEDDLRYAAANLPTKAAWGSKWAGRATRGAAKAYLAKVYLYQERYAECLALTTEVINSGEYNLSTPYDKIFTEEYENGPESVFEAQAESRQNIDGLSTQYAEVQGVRGAVNLGWGFNVPSQALVDAYEPHDPRRKATIIFRGETLEDGEFIPLEEGLSPYCNKKAYASRTERSRHPLNPLGGWINIRFLRYADVVLMHAEAANETGDTDEALLKLEMIRARARGGNTAILSEITERGREELRTKIRHERRVELGMEHERYYDLVRWGEANDRLPGWTAGRNELFPIPQVEIDRSNGILKPNPGY